MKVIQSLRGVLWGEPRAQHCARVHYIACVSASRNPFFYTACSVSDSLYGRFEMLMLHVCLLLRRMQQSTPHFDEVRLALAECFLEDMEHEMREMGVSDLRVGGKVKNCVGVLYGRYDAYDAALTQDNGLEEALTKNIFSKAGTPTSTGTKMLSDYVKHTATFLQTLPDDALRDAPVPWPSSLP